LGRMFGKDLDKGTVTLIEGKFYWAQHASVPPDTSDVHYFSTVIPLSNRYHPLATCAAAWCAWNALGATQDRGLTLSRGFAVTSPRNRETPLARPSRPSLALRLVPVRPAARAISRPDRTNAHSCRVCRFFNCLGSTSPP